MSRTPARSRILVVRVGRLGDMVVLTPALYALLEAFPDSEFHLLTSPVGRLVLGDLDPRITRTIVYDRRTIAQMTAPRRVRAELRDASYRHAFVFESNPHYRSLLRGVVDGTLHVLTPSDRVLHYARRCVDLVTESTNLDLQPGWVRLPVTPAGETRAQSLLDAAGIDDRTVVVGFHGTPWIATRLRRHLLRWRLRHKVWPAAAFGALGRTVEDWAREHAVRLKVIVHGLAGDRRIGEAIGRHSEGSVTFLVDAPPDFERYKAVLQRLDLLVSLDTGPTHLAAAVGTPLVCLFSRKNPREIGPYTHPERFTCLSAEETPEPSRGLAAITPARVFDACLPFLEAAAATRRP